LEARLKPCACDAVVVAEPVWTPAQVETSQARKKVKERKAKGERVEKDRRQGEEEEKE